MNNDTCLPNQSKSLQRSLEQRRASKAWECIAKVKKIGENMNEYAQVVRSAPSDIQINGLGQTLAFWASKGKNCHTELLNDISAWLLEQKFYSSSEGALEWIVNKADSVQYRRATVEVLAFLSWMKRFAEAELKTPKTMEREKDENERQSHF
jgi:CRISPR-associated protein Cmr5